MAGAQPQTSLSSVAVARMSPKGPATEACPKTEVRVSCVAAPGAEPQGIRVRISEPRKERQSLKYRCPSISEKDFYRKSSSLDRRDRYPTIGGLELRRGSTAHHHGGTDRQRRNPMLDRKNRFFFFLLILRYVQRGDEFDS